MTETPRTIPGATSSLFAGDATCSTTAGLASSSNLPARIIRAPLLPDGVKPYYIDERGGIAIVCGDCREILPSLKADVVVTDPPYGIRFAAQPTKWQRRAGAKPQTWDDNAPALDLVLQAAPTLCVWGGNYFALPPSRGWFVWTKPDAPPSMGSVEMAWTNLDQNARHISHSIGETNAERVGHPTQKPLRVMIWNLAGLPDGLVLDPFMGSGTTLVAAKLEGRRAIGIEIEERYAEIAARRLDQEVLHFEPDEKPRAGIQGSLLAGVQDGGKAIHQETVREVRKDVPQRPQ